MNRKSKTSWRLRRGLTLVEVLAGMALTGTLLAAILVADGKLTAQAGRARQRIEACQVADALLTTWWKTPDKLPRNSEGEVEGNAPWRWRTRVVPHSDIEKFKGEIVQLQILAAGDDKAAIQVEILLPKHDSQTTTSPDAR